MTQERIDAIELRGARMTTSLGLSDKTVFSFWKSFEQKKYKNCLFYLIRRGF